MNSKKVRALLKFYGGEKKNPYIGKNNKSAMWWEGEKSLLYLLETDGGWERIIESLNEAVRKGGVLGALASDTLSTEQKAIIFYLDLWHGKNYPYDNLDDIYDYVKA